MQLSLCKDVSMLLSMYIDKMGKRNPAKCILVDSTWYNPLEVEAVCGKKQKIWRQTSHLGKPLANYNPTNLC